MVIRSERPEHQRNVWKDYYNPYHVAILGVYVRSFIFEAFYHSTCFHPLKVTRRNWQKQQAETFEAHGNINTAYGNDIN